MFQKINVSYVGICNWPKITTIQSSYFILQIFSVVYVRLVIWLARGQHEGVVSSCYRFLANSHLSHLSCQSHLLDEKNDNEVETKGSAQISWHFHCGGKSPSSQMESHSTQWGIFSAFRVIDLRVPLLLNLNVSHINSNLVLTSSSVSSGISKFSGLVLLF